MQGRREVWGVVRSFVVSINSFMLIHDGCVYDCQFTFRNQSNLSLSHVDGLKFESNSTLGANTQKLFYSST